MKIDYSRMLTAEQKAEEIRQQAMESAVANRRAAYAAESDPLRNELIYDATVNGVETDLKPWLMKVQEIKERFPFPADAE